MPALKTHLLRAGLGALYRSGLCALLDARAGGVGIVFMLHHVLERYAPPAFAPNRGLEVAAGFLDSAIVEVRKRGYDIVDLDEARRRLVSGDFGRRFACFTLDDGYADNCLHAHPVFARHAVPYTLYVNSGMPDGSVILWWHLLERVLADNDKVEVQLGDGLTTLDCGSAAGKYRAWNAVHRHWRPLAPDEQRRQCLALGARYDIDAAALCRELAISWDQLRSMLASGLLTVGAHTATHSALTALTAEQIRQELARDCATFERELSVVPKHFAYPYGDSLSAGAREFALLGELDFDTAVTTRKGVLFAEHAAHLHALPRLSLNGDFQNLRYVRALMSGAPFALRRGWRRLDVA